MYMPDLQEVADTFVNNVQNLPPGPGVSLDGPLAAALQAEGKLRSLFVHNRVNPVLSDPYIGLVNIFNAPADIRVTRARIIRDENDLKSKYVLPVGRGLRRSEGSPAMVNNFEEFMTNWNTFTNGSLARMKWDNVIVAGGAVQACLAPGLVLDPLPWYYFPQHRGADVDVFLYGMTAKQAEEKMKSIYKAICAAVPHPVTCVRTKHAVTIHSQFPYRPVQIVLRLLRLSMSALMSILGSSMRVLGL
ncbi:hypothetical protein H1R20_g1596, partial [Candolleomyces eurysporus]